MKKSYLIFATLTCITSSMAQLNFQGTELNALPGDSYTLHNSAWVNPGTAGDGITWDLSSMVSTGTTVTAVSAANSSFPGTNVTLSYAGPAQVLQLNNNAGQQMYGMIAGGTTITYSNPMQVLACPLNRTVNSDDTHAATFISGGISFVRSGSTNVTCDGSGTLITPEGTFTNVLRVLLTQDYADNYSGGTLTYHVEAYAWYQAGVRNALASVTTYTNFQGTSQYAQYLDTETLGTISIEADKFAVGPNPVTDLLQIECKQGVEVSAVELIDLAGKTESKEVVSSLTKSSISTADLNPGMYIVRITLNDQSVHLKKIIKE